MKLRRARKLRFLSFALAAASAAIASAATAPIEFSALLKAGGKTRIALTDTATKKTTWVEPGDPYAGYTIDRYDDQQEAVILKKNGEETRLVLISAKTPEPTRAASAPTKPATTPVDPVTSAIRNNLRQLAGAARRLQIERGMTTVTYNDLVGPDKPITALKPAAGEDYSTLSFGPTVSAVSVTTATGATVSFELPPATPVPAPTTAVAATTSPAPSTPTETADAAASPLVALPSAPAAPTGTAQAAATDPGASPASRQPSSTNYVIQNGDTWERISASSGVPVMQLKQLNPAVAEGSPLPAGQTIRVR